MVYDNTKLDAAFDAWLDANVDQGYGTHYAGDLLDDFDEFLMETKMLKRNPGRVVFGRKLGEAGFERRKYLGLTHYDGLTLKKPRISTPKRYKKTVESEAQENADREDITRVDDRNKTPESRKKYIDDFHQKMQDEDTKRLQQEADSDGPPT